MADRTLSVKIIGDERDLLRAFGRSTRATNQFEAQMSGVSRSVRNVFAAAGVALGATAIVQAFRSTISAAIDFESSFAGVRKTVDATEPQLQALATGFRSLSREIPVSVEELNRIGEAAGQLGIQRTAILDFTETIAAIGVSTNLASDQAADAFARLANITQLPQDQFDNLGSTVVELGNKLAATESEITDFGLRIAAAGKIVGLTVDETLAIAGAFTSVGVEAEAGGTAVSKVFIALANAVQTGGKQLETFADTAGTSVAEFRRAFETDTAGAFTAFVEGLKRVDAEGGNVFQTLKDLGLTDVRLVRAFLSISQSGDLLNRSLAIGSRAWEENSALQEEAAKRYETTASKLQIFQNRVNDLQITLGNVLAPALLEIITPLGEWLEQTENQERVQRALIDTLDDLRAIFEGVRAVVVPLAEATKSLADRMGGLKNAVELLLVAMVAAKVVSFGTALTGLGTTAVVTTTKVNLLRTALLRLGALGVIAVGVEIIIHRDEIDDFVRGRIPEVLGGKSSVKIPLEPELRLGVLRDIVKDWAAAFGKNSAAVQKLRAEIRILEAELGVGSPTAASLHEERPRPGRRRDSSRAKADAVADAIAPIKAATDAKTQATKQAIAQGKKDTDAQIAAEKLDRQRLRNASRRAARISDQFEALGLTATGEQRAPSVGALRGRLASIRDQVKGTPLDTDKTRSQLDAIAKVLKGKFGAVGRDVRLAILDMFNQIASGFKDGGEQVQQGPLTKTSGLNTKKVLAGLGLSEEEIRALRGRLSSFNTAGQAPANFATAGIPGGFGGAQGPIIVESHTTINLDGDVVARAVTRNQQKQKKRNPQQKRGPNRTGGF